MQQQYITFFLLNKNWSTSIPHRVPRDEWNDILEFVMVIFIYFCGLYLVHKKKLHQRPGELTKLSRVHSHYQRSHSGNREFMYYNFMFSRGWL